MNHKLDDGVTKNTENMYSQIRTGYARKNSTLSRYRCKLNLKVHKLLLGNNTIYLKLLGFKMYLFLILIRLHISNLPFLN